MNADPVTVYRLIKILTNTKNLLPVVIATLAVLAIIGIVQPLGEVIEDDYGVL